MEVQQTISPPVSIQPTLPQLQSNQRPHSSFVPHSDPQQGPEALETEKTQGYSTLHSMDHTINYNIGSQSQALRFPFPPGSYPLPPEWQKTPWTGFSADQLQHLEAMFQEDKFPDIEKKRLVAASFGVTPHNIKVWFRNRRSRWRKENAVIANVGDGQSRVGYTPHHQISPTLPTLPHSSLGAPPVSHFYVSKPPQFAPVPPSVPILSTQMAPSHSSLLSSLSSPGQSREWDTGQHQLSSQGSLVVFLPHPMHSPPPPLLLSPLLPPPFTMTYYSANPTPPLLNTPPFFLDPLAGGSTLTHYVTQSLPTDTSSLFDLDYLMSSQLQSSYPTSQPQLQPDTSLPSMPYLTPSPYLTPNPPGLNPTSYLTLGPEGNSSGVVTTSTSDPTCFQSQSTGQILLQSSDQDAGSAAYQPSPQGQPEQSASHAPM
ncbi:homeobox protein NOBOX-like isoform X2 [Archocentrus centrarchus]|uniref:homeobox protein NOBOX-like isoform X2 n=1 Tax=Archocentrus centrarchus TaxID=63155 RepID=UPI0011E9F472|nr:homeobox protein NOBOX-like isoform X2 [Archocentrus centrarchus]